MTRSGDVVRVVVVTTLEHHTLASDTRESAFTNEPLKGLKIVAAVLIKRNHHDEAWWYRCGLECC
jgi:hypothetical protein